MDKGDIKNSKNTIIIFTGDHETSADMIKGEHLLASTGDGEFTACGLAVVDYDHERKEVKRGGITCKSCLDIIKYFKSIKI